jgi:hypothetical protein
MIEANEGFKCKHCKKKVEPDHSGSCRNHCNFCLYSMHVDNEVPGDRASECHGMMPPVGIELNKNKGVRIHHMCQKCGKSIWNRQAPEDNWDLICELSRVPREG